MSYKAIDYFVLYLNTDRVCIHSAIVPCCHSVQQCCCTRVWAEQASISCWCTIVSDWLVIMNHMIPPYTANQLALLRFVQPVPPGLDSVSSITTSFVLPHPKRPQTTLTCLDPALLWSTPPWYAPPCLEQPQLMEQSCTFSVNINPEQKQREKMKGKINKETNLSSTLPAKA